MFAPLDSPHLVPFDGSFRIADAPTIAHATELDEAHNTKRLKKHVAEISEIQRRLYAADTHALLVVFQAMDAAGKDGTIRSVFTGVNPAGFQVSNFKAPSREELDHDFLWRVVRQLPERGRIGVFNRSHYEETLVVRVHPEFLGAQNLPGFNATNLDPLWLERFESIRSFEQHLTRNGTVVIKFFLHVSQDEQAKRLLARLDDPEAFWKFEAGDMNERAMWPQYMHAFEETINHTSREHAPWYAIPADDKPFMRAEVARIIKHTLRAIGPQFPEAPTSESKVRSEARLALQRA